MTVIGRTTERSALGKVLASARNGFSETLVVRGKAGIGKTALLEYAVNQAKDFRVLRVTGIESEMELGFAGLHQLIQPIVRDIQDLPGPQRAALESAFGLVMGPAPDRFLVGLATLTLLSDVAGRTPDAGALLVAVDDAQWLDQASAEVLAFAARRLDADRVAFLLTVREDEEKYAHFDSLDSLRIRELTAADASELITSLVSGAVSPGVASQIAERAGGNPLALVETTRELSGEQLAGAALLPDPLPLGDDAQHRYWRKISALPPDEREFLLVAAADASGDTELVEQAAVHLGLDPRLADAGEVSGLVTVADRVTFRHPLIRSAVYSGSPQRNRQRVHAAIADVSDPDRHPGRVAWHRAAAAEEPDEEIAALLESTADRNRQRGGHAAAAAFLRRAAELSPDPERRAGRLLAAARAEFTAGRATQATDLLDQAEPGLRDPRWKAQALQFRGEIQMTIGDGRHAPHTLLQAGRAWAPLDPEACRNAMLDAMRAQVYAGGQDWAETYVGIRAAYPGDAIERPTAPDLVLDGFSSLLSDGPVQAGPVLLRAVRAISGDSLSDGQRLRWSWGGICSAIELLDSNAVRLLAERFVMLCRSRGALTTLPAALDYLGIWNAYEGHLAEAEATGAEGREILAVTGTPDRLAVRVVELLVPAWRGQEDTLREASAKMRGDYARRGQWVGALYPELAYAIFGLGTRDYASALEHARAVLDVNIPAASGMILPYVVEAAVHCEDWETAERALTGIRARAEASRADWGLGLLAQGRALALRDASPDGDAKRGQLFGQAIAHLQRAGTISDLARARLLFGEWLRRKKRRRQAREHLVAAQETFESIGAAAFAERARLEADANGTRTVSMAVSAQGAQGARTEEIQLTERERQIARLVVQGATNAEVAARLFISASTVDYHLRHVYRKLGVSSRTMLSATVRDRL